MFERNATREAWLEEAIKAREGIAGTTSQNVTQK
jgi:hypothetical protein